MVTPVGVQSATTRVEMDPIGASQGFFYCTDHSGKYKIGAVILAFLFTFALLANSLLVYFLVKVPLHPMAKTFMIIERMFSILQCALVESLKVVFYYTSCQPNWSLLATIFNIDNSNYVVIPLPNMLNAESKSLWYAEILIQPTINCTFLEKISILFNTGCLLFFTMNCVLRFYLIVVKQASPQRECLTSKTEIVAFTVIGFVLTLVLFTVSLDDQFTFSRDCLALNVMHPPPRLSKIVFNSFLISTNAIDLVLLVLMVITIVRAPAVNSTSTTKGGSKSSRHLKPVVGALFQLLFSFLSVSYIIFPMILAHFFTHMSKFRNNIASNALVNSLGVASIHCYTPALIFWSSTECLQALKSVVKRTFTCDRQSKKIDYPILVMSDRDKALALARQATEWRKKQLSDAQKTNTLTVTNCSKLQPEMIQSLSRLSNYDDQRLPLNQREEGNTNLLNVNSCYSKTFNINDETTSYQSFERKYNGVEMSENPKSPKYLEKDGREDIIKKIDNSMNERESYIYMGEERPCVSTPLPRHRQNKIPKPSITDTMSTTLTIDTSITISSSESCHLVIRPLSRIQAAECVKETMSSLQSRHIAEHCSNKLPRSARVAQAQHQAEIVIDDTSMTEQRCGTIPKINCLKIEPNGYKFGDRERLCVSATPLQRITWDHGESNQEQIEDETTRSTSVQPTTDAMSTSSSESCNLVIRPLSRLQTLESVKQTMSSLKSRQDNMGHTTPTYQHEDILFTGIGADSRPLSRLQTVESVKDTMSSLKLRYDKPKQEMKSLAEKRKCPMEMMGNLNTDSFVTGATNYKVAVPIAPVPKIQIWDYAFSTKESDKDLEMLSQENGQTNGEKDKIPVTPVPRIQIVKDVFSNFESGMEMETQSLGKSQSSSRNLKDLLQSEVIISCKKLSLMDKVDDPVHKMDAFKIEVDSTEP